MGKVDQYTLGKELYHDWRVQSFSNNSYEIVKELGKENINMEKLKSGFIYERCQHLKKDFDNEDIECFFGAMDEIGVQHWG